MDKLEFKNITMDFPGVKALDDVSFCAKKGKVLGLVGENGAGKSTLLKILYGDFSQTRGEVFFDGVPVKFHSPSEAIAAGVSIIYQERQIFKDLSVAENLFIGHYTKNKAGLVNYSELNKRAKEIIDELELDISPTEKVGKLSVAMQQMVEIMKAYNRRLEIIAFDEPTASLDNSDVTKLFKLINKLRDRGVIILYVSHRLKEIFNICQEIVVFKDGKLVGKKDVTDVTEEDLISLMVGRKLGEVFNSLDRNTEIGDVIFEVKKMSSHKIDDLSFTLRKGEILGFSGLVGAGRTELMRLIYGADKKRNGQIFLDGKEISVKEPYGALKKGISYCSEDRKLEGIIPFQSLKFNISIAVWKKIFKFRQFVNFRAERKFAKDRIAEFDIKSSGMDQKIYYLSGGNQQKAIVARFVSTQPKVLILDEPTKGIDVGAKSEMYKKICALTKKGISVIFISSELPEIIGMCDRVIVMSGGRITGELMSDELSEERLLSCAL
jgi:ABC-type sugar transport system ATPase subunit